MVAVIGTAIIAGFFAIVGAVIGLIAKRLSTVVVIALAIAAALAFLERDPPRSEYALEQWISTFVNCSLIMAMAGAATNSLKKLAKGMISARKKDTAA
jgi:hypothetical protein